jgi:hypothetical protein
VERCDYQSLSAPVISAATNSGHGADDLGVGGEPAKGMFGEGYAVLDADIKDAATGPPQRHLRAWSDLADEVRRLTGARLIASLAAVFDFDVHRLHPLFVATSEQRRAEPS